MKLPSDDRSTNHSPAKLLTKNFALLCLSTGTLMMGFYILLPALPLYVKNLGGTNVDVGLVMGVFSASAVASRLLVGPAVDRWGRKRLLFGGISVFFLGMVACLFVADSGGLALTRLFQGLGFGVMTTAGATLVADLAPPRRRTQAVGYFTMFSTAAMAAGPGVGVAMLGLQNLPLVGFPLLFATGAVLSALSLSISLFIHESHRSAGKPATARPFSIRDFFVPATVPLAVAMSLSAPAYGALVTFLPLYAGAKNVQNVGLFFFLYALVVLISRPFTGILADRIGPRKVLVPAMSLACVSLGLLSISSELPMMATVAVLFGLSHGNTFPSLLAMGIESVPPHQRGVAVGIFMASFDLGIALGTMAYSAVAEYAGYSAMFLVVAIVAFVGLVYFLLYPRLLANRIVEGARTPLVSERD